MPKHKKGELWEDREVLFDLPFDYLKLRPNEKVFDRIEPIEDTKGNSGAKGRMVVTNLRIIWHSLGSPRINLSVGLNCIISSSTKVVNSGLRCTTQALYVLAGFKTNKYEFIFTNLAPNCVRHYTSVAGVHKAYANSRLYRDLKLRGAIINNKQIKILPLEKICFLEEGIWNLSSESGTLGILIASNVRLVWRADVNDAFNVSMPYLTIESVGNSLSSKRACSPPDDKWPLPPMDICNQPQIRSQSYLSTISNALLPLRTTLERFRQISIRDSKFGEALVIVIRQSSGGFVLGFRASNDRLRPLLTELQALHQAYTERPVFGVEMNWGSEISKKPDDDIEDLQELGEPRGEMGPNIYLATQHRKDAPPVYSSYLGLAIEPLQEGFTLKNLFEVQTTS